jgi:hypothetical protein
MIHFEHVTKGPVRDLSFDLDSGSAAKILFDSEDRKNILFGMLAGVRQDFILRKGSVRAPRGRAPRAVPAYRGGAGARRPDQ